MSTGLASWMLEQEARGLLTRLAPVEPFALHMPMVSAAAITPAAQAAIETHMLECRRELRSRVTDYLQWLKSPVGQQSPPSEAQRRFTFLKLRFNAVLSQFHIFADVLTQRSEHETGVWLSGLDAVAADALALPRCYFAAPPVICYLDRGPGAAIRRVRTPLPGGTLNPVAIVRVPRERMIGSGLASSLVLGEVVYESGGRLDYVYFPTSSVVSLLYTTEDGSTAEMGLTGKDGVVGIALFLGGDTTPNRAVVQIAGGAFRLKAKVLQEEFARAGPLQRLMLCYTQALITQISQTAVCNRLHSVEKRLCRWLLLSHDRIKSDELLMTQEFISNMLGGRRESVTVAAGRLQDAGLIHYARGHITILDRDRLETTVCECYRIVKEETDRLLGVAKRPGFNT